MNRKNVVLSIGVLILVIFSLNITSVVGTTVQLGTDSKNDILYVDSSYIETIDDWFFDCASTYPTYDALLGTNKYYYDLSNDPDCIDVFSYGFILTEDNCSLYVTVDNIDDFASCSFQYVIIDAIYYDAINGDNITFYGLVIIDDGDWVVDDTTVFHNGENEWDEDFGIYVSNNTYQIPFNCSYLTLTEDDSYKMSQNLHGSIFSYCLDVDTESVTSLCVDLFRNADFGNYPSDDNGNGSNENDETVTHITTSEETELKILIALFIIIILLFVLILILFYKKEKSVSKKGRSKKKTRKIKFWRK